MLRITAGMIPVRMDTVTAPMYRTLLHLTYAGWFKNLLNSVMTNPMSTITTEARNPIFTKAFIASVTSSATPKLLVVNAKMKNSRIVTIKIGIPIRIPVEPFNTIPVLVTKEYPNLITPIRNIITKIVEMIIDTVGARPLTSEVIPPTKESIPSSFPLLLSQGLWVDTANAVD